MESNHRCRHIRTKCSRYTTKLSSTSSFFRPPSSVLRPFVNSSSGSRTPLSALKGQNPGPIDERASSAHNERLRLPRAQRRASELLSVSLVHCSAPYRSATMSLPRKSGLWRAPSVELELPSQWVRWRSNPRLRVFSPALLRLSYRPAMALCQRKSPASLHDTGLGGKLRWTERSRVTGRGAARVPVSSAVQETNRFPAIGREEFAL